MPLKAGNLKSAGYQVSLTAPEAQAVLLGALLQDANLSIRWSRSGSQARLEIYCATRSEAREWLEEMVRVWPQARPVLRLVPARDWATNWKRFFRAQSVSKRITVRPPWQAVTPAAGGCAVVIDPGMSFGTGLHGTTRACLRLLDGWLQRHPSATTLDIGCGSGILAIAAACLGTGRITAIDNDPDALRVARVNAAANGVLQRVTFRQADAAALPASLEADLVLANLLADLLLQTADELAAAVRPGAAGGLVLSGILASQFEAVKTAYYQRGFKIWRTVTLAGWKSALFIRAG